MRKRIGVLLGALAIGVIVFAAVFHNGAARFALSAIVRLATGYSVSVGDLRLEAHHGALVDVHVSRSGQAVLDARRIDLYYDLRDLLPGSRHRFGLHAITIDRPQISIVHNENGTYNIAIPRAVSGGTRARSGPNPVPIDFTVRVRDASATLTDEYRYYKSSRLQRVDNINVDISINTSTQTRYRASGDLEDAGAQPFSIGGTIDYARGYALHHVRVKAIPIRTVGNYFINSSVAQIVSGTVRDFDLQAWAFNIQPNAPAAYHLSGTGYLADGQIAVKSLDSPIAHIDGRIDVFDSGFAAPHATAIVGHIPIIFAGGIFDFANPQFRLGVDGQGDLRDLKDVAHFAGGLPIFGGVRVHALIEGDIGDPVVLVGYSGRRFNYAAVPIENPSGVVGLYKQHLVVLPFHATYDGMHLDLAGTLALGAQVESTLTLRATGPSSRMPYLGALLNDQPIFTQALLHGTNTRFDARGYLVSLADERNVNGFYAIDRDGVGTFGPISVRTSGGGTLVAGFGLDRPHGQSAFWASVHDLRLYQPVPIVLPGVNIPQLPPIDAHVVEANLAGTGSADNVVIGGSVFLSPARIAGVPFNVIAARFAGPFTASRISAVHADGPWGTFDGNGTFAPNLIVARGNYSGSFGDLQMFLGGFPVQGGIDGPMGIAIAQGKIYVQAQNAQLRNATIHGIPISSISGTMGFDKGILRVYSAQARTAGGTVVAAGTFATTHSATPTRLTLATTQLDAHALHGFGVPITSGSIRAIGALAPGGVLPNLDAGVVLQHGRAIGYGPFSASAEVSIAKDTLHVRDAIASLGNTFAHVDGSISDLASGNPSYNVIAQVPVGQIAPMARLAGMPTYNTDGSFEGDLRIGGTGADPVARGTIGVPVGDINGLGFSDAHAQIDASRGGIAIQSASALVGSTSAKFSATITKSEIALAMQSSRADLADFNDYFDTGDTLAGVGPVSLAFSHFDHLTYSSGDVDVRGFRYRSFPIGDTLARWTSLRNVAQGTIAVGGEHGILRAAGTIDFAPGAQLGQLLMRSRYAIDATLSNIDLGTWLPTLGFAQVPVTGRVEGNARIRGSFPHLDVSGSASLRNGTIGPLPIESAQLAARTVPGDRIDLTRLEFTLPALEGSGSGSFGFSQTAPLRFQVHAVTDDLPRLVAQISKKQLPITGRIESTLTIDGTMRAPRVFAGVDASNLDAYGVHIPTFIGQVQLHRRDIVVRNAEITFAKGSATIAGSLPLQLQPFSFGPLAAPISMDMTATNVDLAAFSTLLGNGTKLGGLLNGHVGVSGSVRNPRIFGYLGATAGSYVSALETTPITNTVAHLLFGGTSAQLDSLHAQLGAGTLDGSGSLNFGGGLQGGPLGYAIAIRTRGAQIGTPLFGSGTFDSSLQLRRSPGALAQLSGDASVRDTLISFNSLLQMGGGGGTGGSNAGAPFNVGLDVGITAGKNVRVRSGGSGLFGLDIPGEGHVTLAGTLLHPTMAGRFQSAGGTLTYVDHAFKVVQASVSFNPSNGVLPDIHAVATTHVSNPDPNTQRNPSGATDITATVTGSIPNVTVAFRSSPGTYTDQQIIALLLPFEGLVGPIQFTDTGVILPAGQLAGAPAPGSGELLPNIFVRRENGTITIGEEAFNILDAQFASGVLAPLETALGSTLGLSDVNLTVDYGGNVGIDLRRQLASNFYAVYGTTFSIPIRQTYGFAYQPNAFTSAQFTMFVQQGPTPVFGNPAGTISTNSRVTAGQAIEGGNGFTFLFQRLF